MKCNNQFISKPKWVIFYRVEFEKEIIQNRRSFRKSSEMKKRLLWNYIYWLIGTNMAQIRHESVFLIKYCSYNHILFRQSNTLNIQNKLWLSIIIKTYYFSSTESSSSSTSAQSLWTFFISSPGTKQTCTLLYRVQIIVWCIITTLIHTWWNYIGPVAFVWHCFPINLCNLEHNISCELMIQQQVQHCLN